MGNTLICVSCHQPILQTSLMKEDMHAHCFRRVQGKRLEKINEELLRVLCEVALPLEVLTAQIKWQHYAEMTDDLQGSIVSACEEVRDVIQKYGRVQVHGFRS